MVIKKLTFKRQVWLNFSENTEIVIDKIDDLHAVVIYAKGFDKKLKFAISNGNLIELNKKLKPLELNKWEKNYTQELVLDGETWDLQLEFDDGTKKKVSGSNGYPKQWHSFNKIIKWLEGIGESFKEFSYDEAKAIALSVNKDVNTCREYGAAYHFFDINGEARTPDNDVVVIKKSGKILNFTNFVINFKPEHNAKTIKF